MFGFPSSRVTATARTNTANPATVAMVAALDLRAGLALAGRLGTIRHGLKGSTVNSYRGELGPLQRFRGADLGPNRGLLPGASMHLPMTGVPDLSTGPFRSTR